VKKFKIEIPFLFPKIQENVETLKVMGGRGGEEGPYICFEEDVIFQKKNRAINIPFLISFRIFNNQQNI